MLTILHSPTYFVDVPFLIHLLMTLNYIYIYIYISNGEHITSERMLLISHILPRKLASYHA
jgi:hypothetical protein